MRKIGYSVGLEDTFKRVSDLNTLYNKNKDVTLGSWTDLVKVEWNLKNNNIKDVFYSLQLIQQTNSDLLILENLDAIAIANTILTDEQEQKVARAFLLLWAILVNDGEIFVNLLLADFEEASIKSKLIEMIRRKRVKLKEVLRGKVATRRINRVVTVERQEKNRGSKGTQPSIASQTRTEPLPSISSLTRDVRDYGAIEFSKDYFRKVPPRRRDWARSLGLWNTRGNGLTPRGQTFMKRLQETNYIDENILFTYWPMDYELIRSGFRSDLFGDCTRSLWNCLADFAYAYSGVQVKSPHEKDKFQVVDLITNMLKIFRKLHSRKAMLRRELPITIAYPAALACACAKEESVLNLPQIIKSLQMEDQRFIALRRSRITGGALSVKSYDASFFSS